MNHKSSVFLPIRPRASVCRSDALAGPDCLPRRGFGVIRAGQAHLRSGLDGYTAAMTSSCRSVVCGLLVLAGCASARGSSTTDAMFFQQFDRKVVPVTGTGLARLPPHRRAEIRLIQSVLKPEFRSRLSYTYSREGTFVVFVTYGDDRTGGTIGINGCHTPPNPTDCRHICGLGFQTQGWNATSLMENICEDAAPIWLHTQRPLPQFENFWRWPGTPPTP